MLMAVFLGSVGSIDLKLKQPFLQTISYLVLYTFNAFLISSIALRFVYPLISTEGQSFWAIRSAPIGVGKFYRIKFLIAAVPLIAAMELLTYGAHQPLTDFRILTGFAMISLFFVSVAFVAMNLGMGAFYSDFKESNPIRVSSSQGATLTFLLTIVFLIVLVAIIFLPLSGYFDAVMHYRAPQLNAIFVSVGIIAVLSLFVGYISTHLGIASLRKDV